MSSLKIAQKFTLATVLRSADNHHDIFNLGGRKGLFNLAGVDILQKKALRGKNSALQNFPKLQNFPELSGNFTP